MFTGFFCFLICSFKISFIWNGHKTIEQFKRKKYIFFFSLQFVCLRHCSERRFQSKPISDSCQCTQEIEIHQLFLFKHELAGPKKLTYTYFLLPVCYIPSTLKQTKRNFLFYFILSFLCKFLCKQIKTRKLILLIMYTNI